MIEIDEEQEDLQALIIAEEEDEGTEEDIQPTRVATKLPAYVTPRKWKAKVPKDLDKTKSSLQTPLLPGNIIFEGTHLGWVPSFKFKDWDLIDHENFAHLETSHLMKTNQNIMVGVTELEL